MPKQKVCHLTSVHNRYDPRIFYKECISLYNAGYDVTLIVADGKGNEEKNGIEIIDVEKKSANRFHRILITTFKVYRESKKNNAAIYHFHDPELIPFMFLLKLSGKKIIYDVHEDYIAAILYKEYVPKFLRIFISKIYSIFDNIAKKAFTIVSAEKCYRYHYPQGIQILNYPKIEHFDFKREKSGSTLIYTGNITIERGAFICAGILEHINSVNLYMIGKCSKDRAKELVNRTNNDNRLVIEGIGTHVNYDKILESYKKEDLLAGLILFPEEGQYKDREPTKIFEYMAAGIPIICSSFPTWENIVKDNNCGICVDPLNPKEIADAINYILDNPDQAKIMGNNGRNTVKKIYNWAIEEKKLIDLYYSLMNW